MEENQSKPLNDEDLEKWEAGRDLVAEITAGVDDFLSGAPARITTVEVTEEVHNARMAQVQNDEEVS